MRATYPDQHRLCRSLLREIVQVVWLPSPAIQNGEWIVIRVVGGHYGGRRGFFGGKHGQVFASNMQRLPRPYPAGQCHAHGGAIEPDFLDDCPWPVGHGLQGIQEARLGLPQFPRALGLFRVDSYQGHGLADGSPVARMVLGRRQAVFPAPDGDGVHDLLGAPAIPTQVEGDRTFVLTAAIPSAAELELVRPVHGPGGREFGLPLAKLFDPQYLPGVQLRRWVQPETSTLPTL